MYQVVMIYLLCSYRVRLLSYILLAWYTMDVLVDLTVSAV